MLRHILFIAMIISLMACNKSPQLTFSIDEINTPSQASIRGLSVIDANTVWVSGSGGTVMRTSDGGKNWIDCSIKEELENDFRSIHAFDSLRAFVLGINNPALIYATTNGGADWQVMDSLSSKGLFFNSLVFADANRALALSDPIDERFLLIKTNDGGASWKRCEAMPVKYKNEANFAASNTCIDYLSNGYAWFATGGSKARVYTTKNDGDDWHIVDTPIKVNSDYDGIYSIKFKNSQQGIVVGGNFDQPHLNDSIAAYTKDGGKTWLLAEQMPRGFRSCVQHFNNGSTSLSLAMGKTGFDYSQDNGLTWHKGGDEGYYTIRSIDGTLMAYAAGSDGRVARISILMK
ncbi:hypothetical protein [Carboxylicivirga sp. M1479]|uniref:WD40/YVTN/BNR-like repeat-containing protein n=1 Tax=Carboxylicivirga sp. M1479 TaxID=2594476 RepID=UPI00117886FA|nr:hypothetical protein [Carboxylicivirga sp. M1479]TRX65804.1 hypothetical protein FNN09_17020 [Carboxylicivirga sp. M1479]